MNTSAIFKIQTPPKDFVLWKSYKSSFCKACSGIYLDSLDEIPMIFLS